MTEQDLTDPTFFELSDEERARLHLEQQICIVLIRHAELQETAHSNSELTGIFVSEIGMNIRGDGDDDEKAREARKSLAQAIRDARTHKLIDVEMVDGGLRPSVTDLGRATVEASLRNLRNSQNGGTP